MPFRSTLICLFAAVLLLFGYKAKGQHPQKDFIISAAIYNDSFGTVNAQQEKKICKLLMVCDLNDLLEKEIISREDMAGLTLPLGVCQNAEPINFYRGMLNMWQSKAAWMARKTEKINVEILTTSLEALEKNQVPKGQMNLRQYRDSIIGQALDSLEKLHGQMLSLYSEKRATFMGIIADNLSQNILLAYNIQELVPPSHMTKTGEIKAINPIFKAYFYDRLLQEGGTNFIEYFPARYDLMNSYGPFQLTNFAIKDLQVNSRLVEGFRVFGGMESLRGIGDHVLLAALFSYNNWERLSYTLQSTESIEKFNAYFADHSVNPDKQRKLRILLAGITACMHHAPSRTRQVVQEYLAAELPMDKIHYQLTEGLDKQLKKYYRSSVEAYLLMKVYHQLVKKYGIG